MKTIGRIYPDCGYGGRFYDWMFRTDSKPYGSYGNGSAMRVSYIGEYFTELHDVQKEAEKSAAVSHDHPEGVKGAVTTATCVWMAKNGKSKREIHDYVLAQYPADTYEYHIDRDAEWLKRNYRWNESCQGSVSIAMKCFIDSTSYESFLRNVFSIYCDSDTLGAIGGGVAEEFYHGTGLNSDLILYDLLDDMLIRVLNNEKVL